MSKESPVKLDPYGFSYYTILTAVQCGDKKGRPFTASRRTGSTVGSVKKLFVYTGFFTGGHYDRNSKDSDLWVMCRCSECEQKQVRRMECRKWEIHGGKSLRTLYALCSYQNCIVSTNICIWELSFVQHHLQSSSPVLDCCRLSHSTRAWKSLYRHMQYGCDTCLAAQGKALPRSGWRVSK